MAQLILQDGTIFRGESFGAPVDVDGEVVFSTGMIGYTESMTDPSFRGQILVFTYPLIGNYGVPSEELNEWGFSQHLESEEIQVRGVICAQVSTSYSHHAAVSSLQHWMEHHGIPGITGVDTRALTTLLRQQGVMLGALRQREVADVPAVADPNQSHLVDGVSCREVHVYHPKGGESDPVTVLAYDCGMKRNILRSFLRRGVRVVRVPWDFDIDGYKGSFDGVFVSNGPGDPKCCEPTIASVRKALARDIPTFGVCLGNQLLALAVGGETYKLKYGHRGVNQPCVEEGTQRCLMTSQNHGFAVREELPTGWAVWFRNANDGSVEGIRHDSGRFCSVQFHPEASPGPEDAGYLFDEYIALLRSDREKRGIR